MQEDPRNGGSERVSYPKPPEGSNRPWWARKEGMNTLMARSVPWTHATAAGCRPVRCKLLMFHSIGRAGGRYKGGPRPLHGRARNAPGCGQDALTAAKKFPAGVRH